MDLAPRLYSGPPDFQTRQQVNPTLLVSWWATGFSLAIILVRVFGRYIRTERLFLEDWIMTLSIVPLLIRMGFVHVVLIFGTNNVAVPDSLPQEQIEQRVTGSGLVLAARIFYALFLWTAKFTVAEFLGRIIEHVWQNSFRHVLRIIRYFLVVTFIAVVIATLAECQPFSHYWQVVPDPGPKCRQGYAHLITTGVCDIITDLFLVIFPIPVIHLSVMPMKRKISLNILFALPLILVAITCYRVPTVINREGSQQFRSLLASLEILAASAVSNAIVIGSFVRDRGVKKQKFKMDKVASHSESVERHSSRRDTITHHHWGSDSDLAADLGMRLDPELYPASYEGIRPAPAALSSRSAAVPARRGSIDPNWQFYPKPITEDDHTSMAGSLNGVKASPHEYLVTNAPKSPKKSSTSMTRKSSKRRPELSLNDIGGLLTRPEQSSNSPSPKNTTFTPTENQTPTSPQADPQYPSHSHTDLPTFSDFMHSSNASSSSPSRATPSQNQPQNFSRPIGGPSMSGGRLSVQHDDDSYEPSVSPGRSRSRNSPSILPDIPDPGGLLTRNLTDHHNPESSR